MAGGELSFEEAEETSDSLEYLIPEREGHRAQKSMPSFLPQI